MSEHVAIRLRHAKSFASRAVAARANRAARRRERRVHVAPHGARALVHVSVRVRVAERDAPQTHAQVRERLEREGLVVVAAETRRVRVSRRVESERGEHARDEISTRGRSRDRPTFAKETHWDGAKRASIRTRDGARERLRHRRRRRRQTRRVPRGCARRGRRIRRRHPPRTTDPSGMLSRRPLLSRRPRRRNTRTTRDREEPPV